MKEETRKHASKERDLHLIVADYESHWAAINKQTLITSSCLISDCLRYFRQKIPAKPIFKNDQPIRKKQTRIHL